ncbi:multidrug effflux MFS transporter [Pseudooceanicola sp. 502str34]
MFRFALILGLLSMVGPFAIDMYLPALPNIAAEFGATEAATQITLTAYFLAFGVAQLVYGPMADAAGRRLPIVIGLVIFGLGSLGAAFADSVGQLALWRAVQGLGGAAVMVVPRAIVRDRYTGNDATRLMAMVMLVISISPMLAPLAGSTVMAFGGWREIFGLLCGVAALSLALTLFVLPETLAPEHREPMKAGAMLRAARVLVTDRVFMGMTLVGGFGMASFFVFISSASFVYVDQFGLSATQFSLAFALNAVGFFSASQFAAPLGRRIGITRVILVGVSGFAALTALLFGLLVAGFGSLPLILAGLFLANSFLGVVMPTTMVVSLDDHGDIAGMAASLGGTLQMLVGGLTIVVAGTFFDGTATPMVGAIALCGALAFVLAQMTPRREVAI